MNSGALKIFEISVIIKSEEKKFAVRAENQSDAIQRVSEELYKYFGSGVLVEGFVVREIIE